MEFNEVAWFFYWADIIPSFGIAAIILTIILGVLFVSIGTAMWTAFSESHETFDKYDKYYIKEDKERLLENYKPMGVGIPLTVTLVLLILWLTLPIIAIFTPSSSTIYKMGASVIGEQLVQLEEVQEVGGELGELAKDTINMLRSHIQDNTVGD